MLKKTPESPLDCMDIKPINPKGNQPWIFLGRSDVEAEAPILWPPDMKSQLIGKDSDAGKDWGQKEKGMAEDEMVRQHHWFNEHEFEQTLGDRLGQGSLVCYVQTGLHGWKTIMPSLEKCLLGYSAYVLIRLYIYFWYWVVRAIFYFGYLYLVSCIICKYFLP